MTVDTDILIIGAGPVGLFTVFEAGLLGMRCHLIDSLPRPGGQCQELYPNKPIYDIPGHPEITGQALTEGLLEQARPFQPGFSLAERAESCKKLSEGGFLVTTHTGCQHRCKVIAIAAGLGCFEPRKPELESLNYYEGKGVAYMVQDPKVYQGQRVVIAGGGDSALDWTIELAKYAKHVTLLHRRDDFRGMPDTLKKVMALTRKGTVDVKTPCEVVELIGEQRLEAVRVRRDEEDWPIACDAFLPLFGLSPKLGPLAQWGLALEKHAVCVNPVDYQTQVEGVYAIGDINTYPGKLKLILCGFHEATLMCHAVSKLLFPEKRHVLRYTTVSGVDGFDGSRKQAPKSIVQNLSDASS